MPPQVCELRISFWKLPWATESLVAGIAYTMASIINPFITVLGYEFQGMVLNWNAGYWSFFYRKTGSPQIPLAAIMAAILTVAIAAGIVIYGIAWLIEAVTVESHTKTLDQLLAEGAITPEQYAQLKEVAAPPAAAPTGLEALLTMIPTILAIFLIIEVFKMFRRKE